MLEHIEQTASICYQGWQLGQKKKLALGGPFDKLLIMGMGEAAIAAEIVVALALGRCNAPVFLNKGAFVPEWVDGKTLIFALSSLPDNEEISSLIQEVQNKGGRVVGVAAGGKIAHAFPGEENFIKITDKIQTVNAVMSVLFPALSVLSKLGIINIHQQEFDDAIRTLIRIIANNKKNENQQNAIFKAALSIKGKIPLIYGGSNLGLALARHWKNQININCGHLAFVNAYPELKYNELAGLIRPYEATKNLICLHLLSKDMAWGVEKGMALGKQLMLEQGIEVIEFKSIGSGSLARIGSFLLRGAYLSYYLRGVYDIQPPYNQLEQLLKKLHKSRF